MVQDSHTLLRYPGSDDELTVDGHGNMYYMYRELAITSPEAFEEWPHFADPVDAAQRAIRFSFQLP